MTDFLASKRISPDYHQQYLAKNPNGYCGIGAVRVNDIETHVFKSLTSNWV